MVGLLSIETPGGQQILWDFVNWRYTGHKPIRPIGGVSHYNSRPNLFHVVSDGAFRSACKKIAPVALGKMTEEDFNYLLGTFHEDCNKKLRAVLRMWRHDNPCNGVPINAPHMEKKVQRSGNLTIALLDKHTTAGRQLLLDYIECDKTGFHPDKKVGCVKHYRSRPEYQQRGMTASAFRSQAKKIAKDVLAYVPDNNEMEAILEESYQTYYREIKRKKSLRSNKRNGDRGIHTHRNHEITN